MRFELMGTSDPVEFRESVECVVLAVYPQGESNV